MLSQLHRKPTAILLEEFVGHGRDLRACVIQLEGDDAVVARFLDQHGFTYILGQGYYAFIHVGRWLQGRGWADSEPLGQYLAENHGVAIVPGAFFSPFGNDWIRFSYATPVERTEGAFKRLVDGLNSLKG